MHILGKQLYFLKGPAPLTAFAPLSLRVQKRILCIDSVDGQLFDISHLIWVETNLSLCFIKQTQTESASFQNPAGLTRQKAISSANKEVRYTENIL